MSALSTSSCDSSLCETPQTLGSFEDDCPRPGHSRGVSFDRQCVIIPECEQAKAKRRISIPSLGRNPSASPTSPTSTLKTLFHPKMRRRASDQGTAPPLRSCLVRSSSVSGSSSRPRPPSTRRMSSSSTLSSASVQTEPLSPCCRSCLSTWEKGLSPGWEIQFSGGARMRLRSSSPSPPPSPSSECESALSRNVKVVDEVECKRAVLDSVESPVESPCPKWRSRLCPLSKSAGAGSPAFEVGCASHVEDERESGECEMLKKACTGIWITSRPSASPSPSRTITPASSTTHLPSIGASGTSTPTVSPRPTLVIRTSSTQSLEKAREGCMASHSDRVLRSLPNGISRQVATPSPPASIKGYLAKEAASVKPTRTCTPPSSFTPKKPRWWSGVKIGV